VNNRVFFRKFSVVLLTIAICWLALVAANTTQSKTSPQERNNAKPPLVRASQDTESSKRKGDEPRLGSQNEEVKRSGVSSSKDFLEKTSSEDAKTSENSRPKEARRRYGF
jgi:hypothetical protein